MVLVGDSPLMVSGKYNWNRQDCEEIFHNYVKSLKYEIDKTQDPIKLDIYQSQLESVRIEEVIIH